MVRRRVAAALGQIVGQPRIPLLPIAAPLFENPGGVFEFLVFQQPLDQFPPRVVQRILDLLAPRQHHPRLDFDQRTGHFEKIADGVDIELLKDRQILEKLIGDRRDRDFGDLDFVLSHQIEQQIQRPAENLEIDEEIHGASRGGRGAKQIGQGRPTITVNFLQ